MVLKKTQQASASDPYPSRETEVTIVEVHFCRMRWLWNVWRRPWFRLALFFTLKSLAIHEIKLVLVG
jgi:hypothetical protein